jgi:hypothetical protein
MSKKKPEAVYMWYSGKIPCMIKGIGHVQPNHVVPVPKEMVDSLAEDENWCEVEVTVKDKKKAALPQSTTQGTGEVKTEDKGEKTQEVSHGRRK